MTQHNISINASHSQIDEEKLRFARSLFVWIISSVEVPIMLLTLYALCFMVRSRHTMSVFVIHLILSDLIQTLCQMIISTNTIKSQMLWSAFIYSVIASVYFMACIAFERYLLVSYPLWYRTHHSLKSTCLISVIVWFVPLTCAKINPPQLHFVAFPLSIVCLIPYLITVVCFVGTWRGLSHAISLTPHKRKMILASLFLVLLNYTFLFLPSMVVFIFHYITDYTFYNTTIFMKMEYFLDCLLFLNPLVDCILYLFMRSDAANIMLSLNCCCTSNTQQISVRYTIRTTQSSMKWTSTD